MGGWDQLRARLVGQDGLPMIYFFSTCAASIRTIPALQHDPARMEDVDTESEDHCADDARYAAMSRRSCRCRWHARGACRTWDTPHAALPRQGIGSSTDGRGRGSARLSEHCERANPRRVFPSMTLGPEAPGDDSFQPKPRRLLPPSFPRCGAPSIGEKLEMSSKA
jgi:hypothetical protein